jgi:hypothetical protein
MEKMGLLRSLLEDNSVASISRWLDVHPECVPGTIVRLLVKAISRLDSDRPFASLLLFFDERP